MATSAKPGDFMAVSRNLQSALAVDEGFVRVGDELGEAIAILERVSSVFRGLFEEFEGETLATATANLTTASSRISTLGGLLGGARGSLDDLAGSAGTITRRVAHMQEAIRSIGVLTVNARIEVAALSGTGEDFSTFTTEIGRLLTVARKSLSDFDRDLLDLRGHIREAHSGQADFDALQGEAIQLILGRLKEGVGSIAAHHARAASGASAVEERSRQVGQRIATAIMALQIGDITRQRVEHVEQALGRLNRRATGTAEEAESRLIFMVCRLESAQLSATARELDLAIGSIVAAHSGLASDAHAISRLGAAAYGASQSKQSAFLPELEHSVRSALDSLERYRRAKASVERLVASVSDAVAGLDRHIAMVQSLETNIRIMGLNTTLKCSRLGQEGAALSAIAHELRAFGNQTSEDADEITAQLKAIVAVAASLSDSGQAGTTAEITELCDLMTGSVAKLGEVGASLDAALGALQGDCGRVASLLEQTVPKVKFYQDIVGLLDGAAADLARTADEIGADIDSLAPDERNVLTAIAASYTMASERDIHDTLVCAWDGGIAPATSSNPKSPPPASSLDDILF
jgi:hypothetical protein